MDLERFSLPLSRPLETASGPIETRRGFVVRTTIDETDGTGEATPLPGWTESLEACERALESIDDPSSALATDEFADAPAARHGLSLAVLDAEARAADRPLYRYLGGSEHRGRVPVNATVGDGPPEETAAAAVDAVETGYPAIKMKVGARSPEADLTRIEAVRKRCPDVELRVDANGAWDIDTAEALLAELTSLGVTVAEQPLPAENLSGHARLRGNGLEIALDEGLVEHGAKAVFSAESADLLVCKPMALGGLDIAREIAITARNEGLDTLITTTIDGAIARTGAVHLAASLPDVRPCGLATGGLLASDLRADAAPIRDGTAAVPQGKGNIPLE